MWNSEWREKTWSAIDQPWDIIIIGGGITGAGILREAAHAGLRTLLVDANDFGYGTSSRSSKLIHGGYRYLSNRQYNVTYESVREREWMLKEAQHQVSPIRFLRPVYTFNQKEQRRDMFDVFLYDLMAGRWNLSPHSPQDILKIYPPILSEGLVRGRSFYDAFMDDARLLLRIIREACSDDGGVALNYARVDGLLRDQKGLVCGVELRDVSTPDGRTAEVKARVVINASGPWSDEIRAHVDGAPKLRKQRGSHLILSRKLFPKEPLAPMLLHPGDGRMMFTYPWEDVNIIGTTDLDHEDKYESDQDEPFISEHEINYMLEALHYSFPGVEADRSDVISTQAGVRPIISTGKASPSLESRAHRVWDEGGLVTIGGGKYTIFRIMARDVLNFISPRLQGQPQFKARTGIFNPLPDADGLSFGSMSPDHAANMLGRHGQDTPRMLAAAADGELEPVEDLLNVWAELRWAARSEAVVHLDDLLLRRLRIGMKLPNGAMDHMPRIRSMVQPELGWDDVRWEKEEESYRQRWTMCYSPTPGQEG